MFLAEFVEGLNEKENNKCDDKEAYEAIQERADREDTRLCVAIWPGQSDQQILEVYAYKDSDHRSGEIGDN